jgi:hypothetical protein
MCLLGKQSLLEAPGPPGNFLFGKDLQPLGGKMVAMVNHQIVAGPTPGWRNQAIKTQNPMAAPIFWVASQVRLPYLAI